MAFFKLSDRPPEFGKRVIRFNSELAEAGVGQFISTGDVVWFEDADGKLNSLPNNGFWAYEDEWIHYKITKRIVEVIRNRYK